MEPCGDLPSDIKPDLSDTLQKLEITETGNNTGGKNNQMNTLTIPFIDEAVKDAPVIVKEVVTETKETPKNNETSKTGSNERVRLN